MTHKTALIILDGWGISEDKSKSAIAQAKTPNFDRLRSNNPHTTLDASGLPVGLPEGQMGNSEVGHMTIGAGRVLYQDLVLINKAIEKKTLHQNSKLLEAIANCKQQGKSFHLLCMLSDAGVHAHIDHLFACIDIVEESGVPYYVHGFTDGRDCDPESGIGYVQQVEDYLKDKQGILVSLVGRYYGMDRNLRRDKTKLAYDVMVHGIGSATTDFVSSMKQSYKDGVTDEYLLAYIKAGYEQSGTIHDGDSVLFVNYRNDRPLQLVRALTQEAFPDYEMKPLTITMITMTEYDPNFVGVTPLFTKSQVSEGLGELISKHNKTQLRIAETEKYAHVTFFFNGGRDEKRDGEERILVPSPKVYTYDLAPGMSSREITSQCIDYVSQKEPDFICLNYAAPDIVGHTGNFPAVVETCEIVDDTLGTLIDHLTAHGYASIIIADHGNADFMINDDGTPNTAHSLAKVPCILVGKGLEGSVLREGGSLADLAPTFLSLMNITVPESMSGDNLIQ